MSNEISLFSSGAELPAYLKNLEMDEATKALAGGSGGLRISIKGGVWRMLDGGTELGKNEDRFMNMVVVASSSDVARTYYEGTYVEGENKSPTCWASDGIKPDADVKHKQSETCATCQWNVAGSGPNGSRACRFSRRLAVVLDNDFGGKVFKIELPSQSIFGKTEEGGKMPLAAYAKQLLQHRIPITAVVTEFKFDTSSATPKLTFRAVRPLTEAELATCKAQGATPEAQDAITLTVFSQDNGESGDVTAVFSQSVTEDEVTQVQEAVAATPAKPRAPRTTKKAEPVAEVKPVEVPAMSAEDAEEAELEAQMAALKAKKAAAKKEAEVVKEPVVVASKPSTSAGPAPVSVATMLGNWDDDE